MDEVKRILTRVVETINAFGFALIVGSVIYFIIGSVAGVVGGHMLDWSACKTFDAAFNTNTCNIEISTGEESFDHFFHHLFTVTIPWFMLFWGFVLTAISAPLLKLLGYRYRPSGTKH